jgi:hypothetical protein
MYSDKEERKGLACGLASVYRMLFCAPVVQLSAPFDVKVFSTNYEYIRCKC